MTKQPVAPAPPIPPPPPQTRQAPPPTGPIRVTKRLAPATPPKVCPRIALYGVEKWCKTTAAAFSPNPLILMARGEQGYLTLLSAGRVPSVPAELVNSWPELLGWLDSLIADPQGRECVWLDALGGFEALCKEYICQTEFKGNWGEQGFAAYGKGDAMVATEFIKLIQRLDELHDRHGIITGIIGHAKTKVFNDPLGPTYDRFICDASEKVWAIVARWSDCILFGKFQTYVDVANPTQAYVKQRGKSYGGTDRVLFTDGRDAFIAGNRYGMADAIAMPDDPKQVWSAIWNEITRNKAVAQ